MFRKSTSMLRLPINDPNVMLNILAPLFKIMLVVKRSMKSKAKFKNNNKSIYIFIFNHQTNYKKTALYLMSFFTQFKLFIFFIKNTF